MAEEYYFLEEISQNLSDIPILKPKAKKKDLTVDTSCQPQTKKSQENRLHEIEQQLEMAESRCNTLKGQVDYMKMLYNGMNNSPSKTSQQAALKRIDANLKRKRKEHWDEKMVYTSKGEEIPSRDVELKDYTISNVSTIPHRDFTSKDASEAVKSINNIISGITNSVNRLTQLQVNNFSSQTNGPITNDPVGIQNIECLPRTGHEHFRPEKPYQIDTKEKQTKSKDNIKKPKKIKELLSKRILNSKDNSSASVNDLKKKMKVQTKLAEKKVKIAVPVSAGYRKKLGKLRTMSSRTLLTKKSLNITTTDKTTNKLARAPYFNSEKLIELYHNSNAKIRTASDDSIFVNNKRSAIKPVSEERQHRNERLETANFEKQDDNILSNMSAFRNQILSPIDEQEKFHSGSSYYKNYELPTIASKMKQVARTYFENFNFKTIPFVAARSITPSHNLGINIQQVLSIIKGRKPVTGISPTLAYNIELAANKLGSRPLSCLVSSLGSRMNNKVCPLSRRYPMSHLQEMAKDIPEETIEEMNEEFDNESIRLPEMPLAAGDKNVEPKRWISDTKTDKCTCAPKQGVQFNDVYNKYVRQPLTKDNVHPLPPSKRLRNRPWNANNKFSRTVSANESKDSTIQKKEKSLKEILKNLYDEFGELNDRYDKLKNEVNKGVTASNTLLQEIEKMESILQNKEDEITMVMSLYKQVLALKQQVKVLKKRASQSTVVVSPFINRQREYKDMNAAGHLTKLLRHIQQFQGTLKNKAPLN